MTKTQRRHISVCDVLMFISKAALENPIKRHSTSRKAPQLHHTGSWKVSGWDGISDLCTPATFQHLPQLYSEVLSRRSTRGVSSSAHGGVNLIWLSRCWKLKTLVQKIHRKLATNFVQGTRSRRKLGNTCFCKTLPSLYTLFQSNGFSSFLAQGWKGWFHCHALLC